MKVLKVEQGGEAWHRARAGVITASMVKTIRAKVGGLTDQQSMFVKLLQDGCPESDAIAAAGYKKRPSAAAIEQALAGQPVGDWSETAKNYAMKLAIERLSGGPLGDDEFNPWQAARGQGLEEDARRELELRLDVLVEEAGFVTTDDGLFGCSADGFIGDDAGAEFKCFLAPSQLRPILLYGDHSTVDDQCQFGMALTGRRRWYFGLYLPDLRHIGRHFTPFVIDRDDEHIDAMWSDLLDFNRLVEGYMQQLRSGAPGALAVEAAMADMVD